MTAPVALPAGRYARGTGNPRTARLPMAFTRWEFLRGVIATYLSFLVATVIASIWATVAGIFYSLFFGGPIALVTTILVGAPLSLLAGMLLRRQPDHHVHYLAHFAAGSVAGFAGISIYLAFTDDLWNWSAPHLPDYTDLAMFPWLIVYPLLTPFCAMWGWRFTSTRALSAP